MWVVMTASARMPSACRGKYRRVAIVQLNQEYTAHGWQPKMISDRARGVLRVVDYGHHSVGKTRRCAYAKALEEAQGRGRVLHSSPPEMVDTLFAAWGGSA